MTRKPRKKKAKAKASAHGAKPRKRAKFAKVAQRDPLDDFIGAGARFLDLKIEKAWMPGLRANLAVILRLGQQVIGFALPDDAEPAPVFKA
jgi:hypothetical protein